jgi:hypothetical protein
MSMNEHDAGLKLGEIIRARGALAILRDLGFHYEGGPDDDPLNGEGQDHHPIDCPACGGSGIFGRDNKCSTCWGTQEITVKEFREIAHMYPLHAQPMADEYLQRLENGDFEDFPEPDGTEEDDEDDEGDEEEDPGLCPSCGGEGFHQFVGEQPVLCKNCGGTGRIDE